MNVSALILVLLTSGCAVGIDDPTSSADGDSGKGAPRGDGSPMQPMDAGMEQPDSTPADTGSQSTCASVFSGTLATFDFTGEPGNQAQTAVKSTAPNVTATAMTRSGVTAVSGVNSINSSNWSMSQSIDPMRYLSFTITPPNGCTLDLSSIDIDTKASGTGPLQGTAATSDDKFVKTSAFTTGTVTKISLGVSKSAKAVEVRLYGFSASATAGTLRIENTFTVTGALN